MNHRFSQNTPLDRYHGLPEGWSKAELIAEHKKLGGTVSIEAPAATEPGAPTWLPCRYAWLQYKSTLNQICAGVALGDKACIELAIRYIELNYFGSYSGYFRGRFARLLKNQPLSDSQIMRLVLHIRELTKNKQFYLESREYAKLLKRIETQTQNRSKHYGE